MALARVEGLTFAYPRSSRAAVKDVSLEVEPGEVVAVLGASGSGKSTLLRALAGLVPHFHGGRFTGRLEVGGLDTRTHRPVDLVGTVATLFQDPEEQVVFTRVDNEVAFGLENLGTPPARIRARAADALAAVGVEHLAERPVAELSGGELQRVCLASTLALEPKLLLLDEPTSQLDANGARALVELASELVRERGTSVLLAEQRPALPLEACDRVLFLDDGRLVLDAPREEALSWLETQAPDWIAEPPAPAPVERAGDQICRLSGVSFAYSDALFVLHATSLQLRRGEVVALTGANGSGKTTLAKVAAGLLEPQAGIVERSGRACYLSQDAGRYLVTERVGDEVRSPRALAAVGLSGFEGRHPNDLSSGERERVALAAVLAPDPDLLVLDEPTRGVDPERKAELARFLRETARSRATLVVTHDRVFAAATADRIVTLGAREAVVV